jgi:oxygen-independent coproporphyrinogen-3 oxidase
VYGIYIHIPFCEKRCPYCDFYSTVGGDVGAYIENLCREISTYNCSHTIDTIYFGGGTPSYIDAEHIKKILNTIREKFAVEPSAEISIECNPNSLTMEKILAYKQMGINRISIGVQSFSDKTLRILGRLHDVKTAKKAIKMAVGVFDNVSIDLIHSVPKSGAFPPTPPLPKRYLKMIQHVSAYCLHSDKYPEIDENESIKQQMKIERVLKKCRLEKYEVSNFARHTPSRRCRATPFKERGTFMCRHNLKYWNCGEWLGFGTGAQSSPEYESSANRRHDEIMLGLRLARGIPLEWVADKKDIIENLVKMELLKTFAAADGVRVVCTPRGFLLLNQILLKII